MLPCTSVSNRSINFTNNMPTLQWNNFETYALLLISFLLCWIEVWMFESKVLKIENQVSRYLRKSLPNKSFHYVIHVINTRLPTHHHCFDIKILSTS